MLARAYKHSPDRFSEGMRVLSIASTSGALLTKAAGIIMLRFWHWRSICQISSVVALCGAAIVHMFVKEYDNPSETDRLRTSIRQRAGLSSGRPKQVKGISIMSSLKNVFGSPMFWTCGLAHAMGFLARRSDAFLGTFLSAACDVPSKLLLVETLRVESICFVCSLIPVLNSCNAYPLSLLAMLCLMQRICVEGLQPR